jgi:hypothetical protein
VAQVKLKHYENGMSEKIRNVKHVEEFHFLTLHLVHDLMITESHKIAVVD